MKTCPFCAEEIQNEAIVCKYCGRDLTKKLKEKIELVFGKITFARILGIIILIGLFFQVILKIIK